MATVKPALNGKAVETASATKSAGTKSGLRFERYFTDGRTAPFDNVEWEKRTALIGNETLLQQLRAINERLMVFRMIDFDKDHRVESTCAKHLEILARLQEIAAHHTTLPVPAQAGRHIGQAR